MQKPRNGSIDLFRIITALCCILMHADLFSDINPTLFEFARYLFRISTPALLATAGFFYIDASLNGKNALKRNFCSYIKTYCVWTLIYYAAAFASTVLTGNRSLGQFLIERVAYFFTVGSYMHFWFFPALIYSMLITHAVFRLFNKRGLFVLSVIGVVLFIIGTLGSAYRTLGLQIPVLRDFFLWEHFFAVRGILLMGLPYYTLGFWASILYPRIERLRANLGKAALYAGIFMYLLETSLLVFVLNWIKTQEMLFSIYPVTLIFLCAALRFPIYGHQRLLYYGRQMSVYVFCSHMLFIRGFQAVVSFLDFNLGSIPLVILTICITLLSAYLLIKWDTPFSKVLLGVRGEKL